MNQEQRETVERIMQVAERKIWVTFTHEGIHKYPQAATDPLLATGDEYDVSFLAVPHRHMFHFRVWIDVYHSDREVEFIQFKRYCQNLYTHSTLDLNNRSCEMIADDLYLKIVERYPNRNISIEVAEDGENGCLIHYNTHRPLQTINI